MSKKYHETHKSFLYSFSLPEKPLQDSMILLEKAGVCKCEIRKIGNESDLAEFERNNNYAARVKTADDLAIEAVIFLHSEAHPDWDHLRIGIPLSEIPGITDFKLIYNGIRFQLLGNDRLLDEEWVFGEPPAMPDRPYEPFPKKAQEPEIISKKIQNWSPAPLNAWLGDVSLGFFYGKFYIFYLSDRRHHRSKFCTGAHTWGLLRTSDFKIWEHVPDILPFEEQWQTYGTGTPFIWNDKIYLTHGLHTDRYYPDYSYPRGATWAESKDGIHFKPSKKVFDKPENPSIYNLNGELYLFQGYCEEGLRLKTAEKWPEFNRVITTGILSGDKTPTRHTTECPAYFQWKNKHYLLIGFTGMYCSETVDFKAPVDLSVQGKSLYDGLSVPMVAPFKDDRRILAGWVQTSGWGGTLGLRELVYFPDGVLGTRWLEEVMLVFDSFKNFTKETVISGEEFMLDLQVQPGKDLSIRFEGSGEPVVFRIKADEKRAEIFFAKDQKGLSVLEAYRDFATKNAAVTDLRNIDQQYRIRILGTSSRKLNGTIFDAEIAGSRTIIRYFEQHFTQKLSLSGMYAETKYSCHRTE